MRSGSCEKTYPSGHGGGAGGSGVAGIVVSFPEVAAGLGGPAGDVEGGVVGEDGGDGAGCNDAGPGGEGGVGVDVIVVGVVFAGGSCSNVVDREEFSRASSE
jgi:hypothetical protein